MFLHFSTCILALLFLSAPQQVLLKNVPGFPDVCPLISTETPVSSGSVFQRAVYLERTESWKGAAGEFNRTAAALLTQIDLLFHPDPQHPEATVARARQFLDKYVKGRKPILKVRGDLLTFALPVLLWGTYLNCKAGELEHAVLLLKVAWRDYRMRDAAALATLVCLAHGSITMAAKYLPETAVSPVQFAARGAYKCMTKDITGLSMIERAIELSRDVIHKKVFTSLSRWCLTMVTKPEDKN